MSWKLLFICALLTLSGGSATAQTSPGKQSGRHPLVVRKQAAKSQLPAVPARVGTETLWWEEAYPGNSLPPNQAAEVLPDYYEVAHTYVEQMPLLNGLEASAGSRQAIRQLAAVPADVPAGRVFVKFEVDQQGCVRYPEVVKGLRADVDSAVVRAVRQLPDLTAGRQNGRPVRVSLVVAVPFP